MKKFLQFTLACILLLSTLVGCSSPGLPTMPESVTSIQTADDKTASDTSKNTANLYLDNTASNFGYLCSGTKKVSVFAKVIEKLIDITKGYSDNSLNALSTAKSYDEDGEPVNIASWNTFAENDFKYKKKDFYTFDSKFNADKGLTGPLQSLLIHESSTLELDSVNIFVSDLAEQEMDNKLLAQKISDNILSKDDFSVAFYCISSNFSGKVWAPIDGAIDHFGNTQMDGTEFDGVRPFYVLIAGPTSEILSISKALNAYLEGEDIKEGEDFYCEKVLAKRGLQFSTSENIEYKVFTSEINADYDYSEYAVTNSCYNLVDAALSDIFSDARKGIETVNYIYDRDADSNGKGTYEQAKAEFVLPLSDLVDETPASQENITYNITDVQLIGARPEDTSEQEEAEESDEEEEGVKWIWETIDHNQFLDGGKSLMEDITFDHLKHNEEIKRLKPYNQVKNVFEDDEEAYNEDNTTLYTVDSESGALKFTVMFNDLEMLQDKYEAVSLSFKVSAIRNLDTDLPEWITAYDLPADVSTDEDEFYTKTKNLEEFYKFLTGTMYSEELKAELDEKATKTVSDVVVNINLNY